ncbi:MAG: energy transducer TonB [Pseudomonadota bacterium]
MIRVGTSFALSVLITVLFLFALKSVVDVNTSGLTDSTNLKIIDFVRLKREERLAKKERVKPKREKPKKPLPQPKVKFDKPDKPQPQKQPPMQQLNLDLPVNLSASSALGDALVQDVRQERAVNANVIPLARVNPIYPKRAKRLKKEGFVKMEFTITETGSVTDILVVQADPPKLFDRAATRALAKWKFKPKVIDNQLVTQRAVVQIDFKLN